MYFYVVYLFISNSQSELKKYINFSVKFQVMSEFFNYSGLYENKLDEKKNKTFIYKFNIK